MKLSFNTSHALNFYLKEIFHEFLIELKHTLYIKVTLKELSLQHTFFKGISLDLCQKCVISLIALTTFILVFKYVM